MVQTLITISGIHCGNLIIIIIIHCGDNTYRIPDIEGHLQQEGINPEYGNVLS